MIETLPRIYSIGLISPLGRTYQESARAYREGEIALRRAPGLVGIDAIPPTLAFVFPYDQPRDFIERLSLLLNAAIRQCSHELDQLCDLPRIPMHIFLPPWIERSRLLPRLTHEFHSTHPTILDSPVLHFGGPAETFVCAADLAAAVYSKKLDCVLLCAIDSLIQPDLLDFLSFNEEILSSQNPYGFIPGEAASVILISREGVIRSRISAQGSIVAGRSSREPENVKSPKGIIGRGLADCFDFGVDYPISRLIVDLNGQRYRSEEFGFAIANTTLDLQHLANDPEAPASKMGHLGTATGLTYLALALAEKPAEFGHPGPYNTLISTSSPSGWRATMIVEKDN